MAGKETISFQEREKTRRELARAQEIISPLPAITTYDKAAKVLGINEKDIDKLEKRKIFFRVILLPWGIGSRPKSYVKTKDYRTILCASKIFDSSEKLPYDFRRHYRKRYVQRAYCKRKYIQDRWISKEEWDEVLKRAEEEEVIIETN